jgi:hypothetical protein
VHARDAGTRVEHDEECAARRRQSPKGAWVSGKSSFSGLDAYGEDEAEKAGEGERRRDGDALPGSIASFSLSSLELLSVLLARRPYRSQACVHGLRQAQLSLILELPYIICNALRGRARGA